jgi:hypothetical protein
MRRSSFFTAAAAVVSLLGCAPSNPGLTIDGVLVPSDMCDFTANNALLFEARLDVSPDVPAVYRPDGVRFVAAIRVANHLINTGSRIYPLMADPNVIDIQGAEIEILNSDGTNLAFDGLPNPYRVPASGTIASTTSNEPTIGIASVEVLPAQYGASLSGFTTGSIIFSIRVIGVTAGGATLISGRTLLPVTLCSGCLFRGACDEDGVGVYEPTCSPGQNAVTLFPDPSCPS